MAVWSRLYYDLEPYLSEREVEGARLLAFYHRQLGEVAYLDYLADNEDPLHPNRLLAERMIARIPKI